jgi:acyl-CoA dehydrogenase
LNILHNFSNRFLAYLLKIIIFPLGTHFKKPKDYLNHQIAQLLIAATASRQRLAEGAFLSSTNENVFADVQNALLKTIAAEPIERLIQSANIISDAKEWTRLEYAQSALEKNIITVEQFDVLVQAEEARKKVIAVDDFSTADLVKGVNKNDELFV